MASEEDDTRHPVLITEAAPSLPDQRRARVRRYTTLMAFRVPALVAATIVYNSIHNALAAIVIVGASIPLPWIAVLIANDRPPRRKDERSRYPQRQLPERCAPDARSPAPDS